MIARNVASEKTASLWMDTEVMTGRSLATSASADVVVVGSGIAGLSIAYELSAQGLKVAVCDRGEIGSGTTARTTAHLAPICDDGAGEMIKLKGEEQAKLFWESQAAGVDRIETLVEELNISCHFRRLDAFLFPGPGTKQSELDDELKSVRSTGAKAEKVKGVPFKGLETVGCLRYPDQATFHPLQYLRGLAGSIVARGGKIYPRTTIVSVEESSDSVKVTTKNGYILTADSAVVATNSPINDRLVLHTKMAPYRTYAIAITIPKDALPDALYWDTLDPYHYVRQHPGPGSINYLIVGGEDHKTGEADDGLIRFEGLEAWIRNLLPGCGKVVRRWSGQVLDTIDYAAFSGRNPGSKRVYVHTGDSGQGMTHGAMAGLLIPDLIVKGSSPWQDLYDPGRLPLRSLGNYARENITALKNFSEYLAPGELSSYDELKAGQGAIVRDGLTKVAAFRDDSGTLHKYSAACTHVGCHVHWNSTEACWDCPCHGSQFAPDGTALNAPAVAPLTKIK